MKYHTESERKARNFKDHNKEWAREQPETKTSPRVSPRPSPAGIGDLI